MTGDSGTILLLSRSKARYDSGKKGCVSVCTDSVRKHTQFEGRICCCCRRRRRVVVVVVVGATFTSTTRKDSISRQSTTRAKEISRVIPAAIGARHFVNEQPATLLTQHKWNLTMLDSTTIILSFWRLSSLTYNTLSHRCANRRFDMIPESGNHKQDDRCCCWHQPTPHDIPSPQEERWFVRKWAMCRGNNRRVIFNALANGKLNHWE